MPSLLTQILVLSALAFFLWLGLLSTFRRARIPLAGVMAAIVSWAIATMSLAWTLDVLRRIHWPLV